ncbi:MAG: hypothetical protein WKG00_02935 [Polyangiaceae bacterium]
MYCGEPSSSRAREVALLALVAVLGVLLAALRGRPGDAAAALGPRRARLAGCAHRGPPAPRPKHRAAGGGLGGGAERGAATAEDLRHPEVEQLDHLLVVGARQEDVLRLEVAVEDSLLVRAAQRPRRLGDDGRRRAHAELAQAAQAAAEVLALEQLHDDERGATLDAVIEDLHHVRGAQARRRLGLALEAGTPVRRLGRARVHELHRHRPLQHQVRGAPDRPHAAARQQVLERIAPAHDRPL